MREYVLRKNARERRKARLKSLLFKFFFLIKRIYDNYCTRMISRQGKDFKDLTKGTSYLAAKLQNRRKKLFL